MSCADSLRKLCAEAVRAVAGYDGLMDRGAEAIERVLSPRSHARPPVIEEGEHDGGVPAFRFVCPNCGGRIAPDAIDWGEGVSLPPLPRYCPECSCALADLPPEAAAMLDDRKEDDETW